MFQDTILPSATGLSLQDAFNQHKRRFIAASQERLAQVARAKDQQTAHPALELGRKRYQQRQTKAEASASDAIAETEPDNALAAGMPKAPQLGPRKMSKDEIRGVNHRLYNKLCHEVTSRGRNYLCPHSVQVQEHRHRQAILQQRATYRERAKQFISQLPRGKAAAEV